MTKRKSDTTLTAYGRQTVDVDVEATVEISELSDDQLNACLTEAHRRGLFDAPPIAGERKVLLEETLEELLRGRHSRALERFEAALLTGQHWAVVDAWRALNEGRNSQAICFLDRALDPSPAATATTLPARQAAKEKAA